LLPPRVAYYLNGAEQFLVPLIGGVGFLLLIGIGLPCIMAAYYYAWDKQVSQKVTGRLLSAN
jgi:hypothetical protein